VQALKPYDRCKLYKFSYEFQVKLEEASVAAQLNFQLRCRITLGWQNKPTTHLRLGFSKFLQAIRHEWDSKVNIISNFSHHTAEDPFVVNEDSINGKNY